LKYQKIVTHYRPGLDEIGAIFLLQRYGESIGITPDTPIEFMKKGDFENPPMGETDVLYLGCGIGSWANEHYMEDRDLSACRLVARHLDVPRYYKPLVLEITREDRHGSDGIKNHLAQFIKDRYDLGGNFYQIYPWCKCALAALSHPKWNPEIFSMDIQSCADAISARWGDESGKMWYQKASEIQHAMHVEYCKAMAHLKSCPDDFIDIPTYKGVVKAFVSDQIESNSRITQAARSLGAQIVLLRGQLDFDQIGVVIQTKQTSGICLLKVLETLRQHELAHREVLDASNIGQCNGEGTNRVCPYWHGHQAGKGRVTCASIYSGAKTRPKAEKTVMDWGYIKDLVLATLQHAPEGEIIAGFDQNKFLAGDSDLSHVFNQNKQAVDVG
jgi:hypothetical protein